MSNQASIREEELKNRIATLHFGKYFILNAAIAKEAFDPTNGITQVSHDNMTAEALRQGLAVGKYFMFNAAVASEAIDGTLQAASDEDDGYLKYVPSDWHGYTNACWAANWHRWFQGDGRRLPTWKGRFANVTNIVNFYSTQEEVVCDGDGKPKDIGREYSWYNQEYCKGSWTWMLHPNEGGWAFNSYYDASLFSHMAPSDAAELTDAQLQQTPFFLDFSNPEMHTSSNGLIVATNHLYRAEMLAYAIPSESYAVGANPLPQLVDKRLNFNMATITDGQEDLPVNGQKAKDKHRDWQHSTFVQRSYKRTRQLFRAIIGVLKGENLE